MLPGEKPSNSPPNALTMSRTTPPQVSCMPAKAAADAEPAWRWEKSEPAAQESDEPKSSTTIVGGIEAAPPEPPRQAMSATPARPGTNPTSVHGLVARWTVGMRKSSNTNQNGIVAKITAAKPDGMCCWA
jgi:hypothetical protein